MRIIRTLTILGTMAGIGLQPSCAKREQTAEATTTEDVLSRDVNRRIAEARLSPTEGNETEGTVTFIEESNGIRVIADLRNLSSSGKHGFHVHENGDCSAPDGTSAGGHFNPHDTSHGAMEDEVRHVGDLGNLESTDSGGGMKVFVDEKLSFDGESSIIGKSVIVHANADDFTSQPSGAAGPRIACGVIEWAE